MVAACGPCNHSDGNAVGVDNREAQQLVVHLRSVAAEQEAMIEEQQAELGELRLALEQREEAVRATRRAVPRIY